MHPTTIAVVTGNFFILERALSARNHPESAERYFCIAFPRSCQIAAVLLVGVVVSILNTPDLRAQLRAPQGQSDDQKHGQTVQAAMSPDIVTVPDGTPLTLKFAKDLSSTTAKVGDTVEFTTPYTAQINGLVIVPKGMAVSGAVVQVRSAHRGSRNGEVKIAIGKLSLPSGETATLRQVLKSERNGKKVGNAALTDTGIAIYSFVNPFAIPTLLILKGDKKEYRAGTWTTFYFNGPLSLNRGALSNLQSSSYKGPAQVFVKNRKGPGYNLTLFSDQEFVGSLDLPVRLELKPGRYTLSTNNTKEQALQVEVHEDQQYWVERESGGLFAKDPEQHRDEMEVLEEASWVTDRNFALEAPAYTGPPEVFFVNRGAYINLFCGQKKFSDIIHTLRVKLDPGDYSFSTRKAKGRAVQIQVQENHKYWIEIEGGELLIKDFQRLHNDFDHVSLPVPDLDLTNPSTRNSCVPEALP